MNRRPAKVSKQCVSCGVPVVVSFPSEGQRKNGGRYNVDDDSFSSLVRSICIDEKISSIC